mmetsp:Transcript_10437/g.43154  ORF Transcript_10437/g.43154 Transcript_10437/m.43154 type:complete len:224 (+) Transcript_10437:1076-1747(+)
MGCTFPSPLRPPIAPPAANGSLAAFAPAPPLLTAAAPPPESPISSSSGSPPVAAGPAGAGAAACAASRPTPRMSPSVCSGSTGSGTALSSSSPAASAAACRLRMTLTSCESPSRASMVFSSELSLSGNLGISAKTSVPRVRLASSASYSTARCCSSWSAKDAYLLKTVMTFCVWSAGASGWRMSIFTYALSSRFLVAAEAEAKCALSSSKTSCGEQPGCAAMR